MRLAHFFGHRGDSGPGLCASLALHAVLALALVRVNRAAPGSAAEAVSMAIVTLESDTRPLEPVADATRTSTSSAVPARARVPRRGAPRNAARLTQPSRRESPAPSFIEPPVAPSLAGSLAAAKASAVLANASAWLTEANERLSRRQAEAWLADARPSSVAQEPAPARSTRPRPQTTVAPRYPESARRLGVEGIARLRVHVGADGRVAEVLLESSSGHPELDHEAQRAVEQWLFEPARRGDRCVSSWVVIPVEFRIT